MRIVLRRRVELQKYRKKEGKVKIYIQMKKVKRKKRR